MMYARLGSSLPSTSSSSLFSAGSALLSSNEGGKPNATAAAAAANASEGSSAPRPRSRNDSAFEEDSDGSSAYRPIYLQPKEWFFYREDLAWKKEDGGGGDKATPWWATLRELSWNDLLRERRRRRRLGELSRNSSGGRSSDGGLGSGELTDFHDPEEQQRHEMLRRAARARDAWWRTGGVRKQQQQQQQRDRHWDQNGDWNGDHDGRRRRLDDDESKVYGDTNGDGVCDAEDVQYLQYFVGGSVSPDDLTPNQLEAMDPDLDGNYDGVDISYLLGVVAGKYRFITSYAFGAPLNLTVALKDVASDPATSAKAAVFYEIKTTLNPRTPFSIGLGLDQEGRGVAAQGYGWGQG